MPRWTRVPLLTLLALIGLLVLALQIGALPILAREWTIEAPEFAYLALPLAVGAVGAGICVQLALVATGRLVGFVHRGRIFDRAALPWVDGLVVCGALATGIVLLTFIVLSAAGTGGPPALSILMIVAIIGGATATLLLLVMRALLRQAVALDAELREVV
ncbi:MAG: DUF2975 domain-containing protein [Yonghaparkia sp.]|nr:DUF2975 domain-containing protein [Microcella sp.]